MSVLACDRHSCESIMCDRYSSEHGYICDYCFEEAVNKCVPYDGIGDFMNNPKTPDLEDSKHILDREFQDLPCEGIR